MRLEVFSFGYKNELQLAEIRNFLGQLQVKRPHTLIEKISESGVIFAASGKRAVGVIAAVPRSHQFRSELFMRAGIQQNPLDYDIELGWLYVSPEHRRNGVGELLIEKSISEFPLGRSFAATNSVYIERIITKLSYVRAGEYKIQGADLYKKVFLRIIV